ncbi:MAG: hypothetical protein IID49_01045 [Proteobacteria bacterium]|nr:hypothetical protein [Pseudomonadota bacterium]
MRKVISTAVVLTISTCLTAAAQELPRPDDLQTRVIERVPGFWSVTDFRIISTAKLGYPIAPRALLRFEADVGPKKDLFVTTGEEVGPFEIIVRTFEAEVTRTLYGTMDLSYRAGEWSGITNLENSVTDLGTPIDYFRNPVIELGSEEQMRVLSLIRADAVNSTQRAIEEDQRALRERHADAMAALKLRHEQALAEARRTYDAQLSTLKAEFDPAIKDETESLAAARAKLQASHEAAFTDERERLQAEHRNEFDRLASTHRKTLEKLLVTHATTRADLIAQQAEDFATLESGLAAKKKALQERIAAADELIKMHEILIARNEVIADNNLWIKPMTNEGVAKRNAFFESLLADWSGSIDCTNTVAISVSTKSLKRSGMGMSGALTRLTRDGKQETSPAHFVFTGDNLAYPMSFKLIYLSAPSGFPEEYGIQLSEEGIFKGTTKYGSSSVQECVVILAR